MDSSLYTYLFAFFFFLPPLAFCLVAMRVTSRGVVRSDAGALDEYLLASRQVTQPDYINSTAAYMLQVSTTFYFVYWGYNYGLSNVWYMASWALGLYLFSVFSEQLVAIRLKFDTLPAFLADGRKSPLRIVAALITILAFIAMYYVESYFCADFISVLADPTSDEPKAHVWWVFFLTLTLFTAVYSLFGGLRRVVVTDRWQISFAYVSLSIVLSYCLTLAFEHSPATAVAVLVLVAALFASLIYINWVSQNRLVVLVALVAALSILLVSARISFRAPASFSLGDVDIPGPFAQVLEPWGIVTLFGFLVLNLLWQFCDNSNFQRLASLQLGADHSEAVRVVRRIYRRLIVVSPLTWGFGIVLGISIRAAGVPVPESGKEYVALLVAVKHAALAGDPFALTAILALSAALTSIMMETVDSALIAGTQSLLRDIGSGRPVGIVEKAQIALGSLAVVVAFAIGHKAAGNLSILTVLAGAYSALVVLAPPTIMKLIGRKAPDAAVIAAVLFGFVATWIATFGPVEALPTNVTVVLPLFVGPIATTLVLLPWIAARGHAHAAE